jgi:hypothetical protein
VRQERFHVLPGEYEGWIVREEGGREHGSFADRDAAEVIGRALARMYRVDLFIHDRSGKIERRVGSFRRWFRRLL